jgi:DNA modification methylase
MSTPRTSDLSRIERDDLARCEAIIERGRTTFVEVGTAMLTIRDARLYRATHGTFEAYCRERWGLSKTHANRMIEAADVAGDLTPTGVIPTAERQTRPLAPLGPNERRAAWTLAVESAPNGRPTGAMVRAAVDGLSRDVSDPRHAEIPDLAGACQFIHGGARPVLLTMEAESFHCGLCSPPYWKQRDYGVDGQIGREPTLKRYLMALVEVFHEVARVLRPDGTLFIVIGDKYHRGRKLGIPDRLARALERDGWRWVESIIWAKAAMVDDVLEGSCMPGSQKNRSTSAYETVLHLDRGQESYFDLNGVLAISGALLRNVWRINTEPSGLPHYAMMPSKLAARCIRLGTSDRGCCPSCLAPWRRLVEKERVPTRPGNVSKVYEDPAGSPYKKHKGIIIGNRDPKRHTTVTRTVGWEPTCRCGIDETVPCRVIDPFGGLGTTAIEAAKLGRVGVAIELNPEYCDAARRRIRG